MIISKTPLRASLFGGGTDFKDYYHNSKYGYGSVISAALDMYVYIIVNKRFDDKIRLVYFGNELVDDVNDIKHNIIREALKLTKITKGIEIIYLANLPMTNLGLGLASSSALTVGVLNALHKYKNEPVTKEQLAREAIDIELNKLKQQIGIQDQYAVSYGGFHKYIFNKDDTVDIKPINLTKEQKEKLLNHLMLFYTGNPRDSKQIFKEQKETTKNRKELLDTMIDITEEAIEYLKKEKYNKLGKLLDKAWNIKKQFASGITNKEIDNMYKLALQNGALGGKVLGAGGGGFLLLYVPITKKNKVKKALSNYTQVNFNISNTGSQITYQD